jgi:hypothetical protein
MATDNGLGSHPSSRGWPNRAAGCGGQIEFVGKVVISVKVWVEVVPPPLPPATV